MKMESQLNPNPDKNLKRGFFNRLLGKPATGEPQNHECWRYEENKIIIDLSKTQELSEPGGAVRFEDKNIPHRVVVIHGDDSKFHAFHNKCRHAGRRIDPVPGALTMQCCSVNKVIYDYNGEVLKGPAKEPLKVFPVEVNENDLIITIS